MKTWHIGIDETGNFSPFSESGSFVAAAVMRSTEKELLGLYERLSAHFPASDGTEGPSRDTKSALLRKFHFRDCSEEQRKLLADTFLPKMEAIIVSKGRPPLLANAQDWWLLELST